MILIKVEKNIKMFIKKCLKMNIGLYNIKYIDEYLVCKIDEKDLENIKNKCYFSKISILKYYGKNGLKNHLIKYCFDYCLLFIIIIALFFISNMIIEVEIKHENKILKENIKKILNKNNIRPFTFTLTVKELNEISNKIIKNSDNTLEWLSITRNGMKYIVSFEERIVKEEETKEKTCHVVATKDAVIKKVITHNGENLVERDKMVKKGDILITGTIMKDDEVKKNVCAQGIVLAETWYKINISYPLKNEKISYTKQRRINFKYNGNYFYKDHYDNYREKKLFSLGPLEVIREYEIKKEEQKLTKEKALKEAKKRIKEELIKKIGNNIEIIDEKVLKELEFDSKIELEVFISVIEDIGKTEYFEARD